MTKTCLTYDVILRALPEIIVDCLGVDADEVIPTAKFFDDLGGESIDQLDLSFRCERAFGIKGPFQPLVELYSTSLDAAGCLQPHVLEEAGQRMPFLRTSIESLDSSAIHPRDFRRVFTVEMIARLIEHTASRG